METQFDAFEYMANAAEPEPEIVALRARVAELEAALREIHAGDTMRGIESFTHADVIQSHYAICRRVLAKGAEC